MNLFLHSKFLEIVKFANELGFCQLVITNGYLLNNSKSKEILRYLNGVSVSLHGSESYHNKIVNNKNSYKLAISGIEMLKKEFPQIVWIFVTRQQVKILIWIIYVMWQKYAKVMIFN